MGGGEKGSSNLANIIIDALLGTGVRGGVEGWLAEVIADVNVQARAREFLPSIFPRDYRLIRARLRTRRLKPT